MKKTLTPRQEAILKIVIDEYIHKAVPVPSEFISQHYPVAVSPATVRHEMAWLEENGYVTRPHTSAGAKPSDEGYRVYVDRLLGKEDLSEEERRLISHLFHQIEREMDQWMKLSASLLARLVNNLGLVIPAQSRPCRFVRVELVGLQDLLALMVLIMRQTSIKQQLVHLEEAASQGQLSAVSNRLNLAFLDSTAAGIKTKAKQMKLLGGVRDGVAHEGAEEDRVAEQVTRALIDTMEAEDARSDEAMYLEGLHRIVSQPEFAQSERMRVMMQMVSERSWPKGLLPGRLSEGGTRVIIGKENEEDSMQDCSLVLRSYGVPGVVNGAVGVLGPTRMDYGRAMATVSYLSSLLSRLTAEIYG